MNPKHFKIVALHEGEPTPKPFRVTEPDEAAAYWKTFVSIDDRHSPEVENLVVVMLNARSCAIGHHTVATVGLSTVSVCAREVFRAAVISNCSRIVVMHNHPSGDPTPSKADAEVSRRLLAAGRMIGIEVLDHIVIGHGRHCSIRGLGLFSEARSRRRTTGRQKDKKMKPQWQNTHGSDFAVPKQITDNLTDCSWRNDACPKFVPAGLLAVDEFERPDICLWADHPDPSRRTFRKRFCVSLFNSRGEHERTYVMTDDAMTAISTLCEAVGWLTLKNDGKTLNQSAEEVYGSLTPEQVSDLREQAAQQDHKLDLVAGLLTLKPEASAWDKALIDEVVGRITTGEA